MNYYYVNDGRKTGPIDEKQFALLVSTGKITPATMVWHEGMTRWQRYAEVKGAQSKEKPAKNGAISARGAASCCECGKTYHCDQMIRYENSWVCAACKPIFFQRVKEGAAVPGQIVYGGFWIRFGAKFIDGLVQGAINMMIGFVAGLAVTSTTTDGSFPAMFIIVQIFQLGVAVAYTTFFLGKFGATPGKMACGLKVVTPEGGTVSYARAFGRHFAEMLSGLILCIGYLMAATDQEKRTLHDRICNTRVIKK